MNSLSPADDVAALLDPLTMVWLILLPVLADEDPSSDPRPSMWLILLLLLRRCPLSCCSFDDDVLNPAVDYLTIMWLILLLIRR